MKYIHFFHIIQALELNPSETQKKYIPVLKTTRHGNNNRVQPIIERDNQWLKQSNCAALEIMTHSELMRGRLISNFTKNKTVRLLILHFKKTIDEFYNIGR